MTHPLTLRRSGRVATVALLGLGAACDSPSRPVPVATVTVTPDAVSIVAGTTQQLVVSPRDARGNTLAGRSVTWSADNPSVATVTIAGFVTGIAPGSTNVLAKSEGKSGTASIMVLPVPVASVRLVPASGSLVVGGSLQFAAELRDANENPLANRDVTWSSTIPGVATVSGSGLVTAVAPGTVTIVALSEGKSGAAVISVLLPAGTAPSVDAISPAALVPGETATISGTGFGTGDSLEVTIGGARAPVLAAGATQLSVTVPCARGGEADVQVKVSGRAGRRSHPVATTTRTLAVGQSFITTASVESTCNELAMSAGNARYLVAVFSASTSANALVDFVLEGNTPMAAVAPRITPSMRPGAHERQARDASFVHDSVHLRVLDRDRARYARLRSAPASVAAPRALQRVAQPPALGDMRSAYFTFTGGCSDTTRVIRARAIHVGPRSIIWEDSTNTLQSSADAMLAGYYRRLGVMFDQEQYDVVRRYFADPLLRDPLTDADGRVHMIFTQRLNGTGAAAYVTSCDQFPTAAARGSNLGEVFYGSVPVTAGSNLASTNFPDGWFNFMGRTVVHEVKHIASMASRVANGAPSLEQSWLEEGTARHAEELWIRESVHRVAWKGNTGFGTAATNGVFCDFHPSDATCNASDTLRRPGYGMRRHFNEIREKLLEPWNWSPYGTGNGQAGSVFYQTTWSLVRYTIDRFAPSDAVFFTALTNATTNGVTNLSTVAGVPMDRLIGGWGLALYADDYPGLLTADADVRFPTWNLRDIYAGLNAAPSWSARWNTVFPIRPTPLAFGAFAAQQVGLRGGSHSFFELSGSAAGPQLLSLRSLGGGAASPTLRVAVVRLP